MSAGEWSKNWGLCSRWEVRAEQVTIPGKEEGKMVVANDPKYFGKQAMFSWSFVQLMFSKGQILSLKPKH